MLNKYKREILSALMGGAGFIIIYVIGKNIIISLTISILLFLAGYLLFKEKPSIDLKLEEISEFEFRGLLNKGYTFVSKFTGYNNIISNSELNHHLDNMINNSKKILQIAEKDKSGCGQISTFINHYLPMTDKVIGRYAEIIQNNISGAESEKFKQSVNDFIKELDEAFEKQLQALYSDDILDASVEMDVLKNIFKVSGLSENKDF